MSLLSQNGFAKRWSVLSWRGRGPRMRSISCILLLLSALAVSHALMSRPVYADDVVASDQGVYDESTNPFVVLNDSPADLVAFSPSSVENMEADAPNTSLLAYNTPMPSHVNYAQMQIVNVKPGKSHVAQVQLSFPITPIIGLLTYTIATNREMTHVLVPEQYDPEQFSEGGKLYFRVPLERSMSYIQFNLYDQGLNLLGPSDVFGINKLSARSAILTCGTRRPC